MEIQSTFLTYFWSLFPAVYLEPSQTSAMAHFCEDNKPFLEAVNNIREKAPSQMFGTVLNMPLRFRFAFQVCLCSDFFKYFSKF